jgi:hypothetical protein
VGGRGGRRERKEGEGMWEGAKGRGDGGGGGEGEEGRERVRRGGVCAEEKSGGGVGRERVKEARRVLRGRPDREEERPPRGEEEVRGGEEKEPRGGRRLRWRRGPGAVLSCLTCREYIRVDRKPAASRE